MNPSDKKRATDENKSAEPKASDGGLDSAISSISHKLTEIIGASILQNLSRVNQTPRIIGSNTPYKPTYPNLPNISLTEFFKDAPAATTTPAVLKQSISSATAAEILKRSLPTAADLLKEDVQINAPFNMREGLQAIFQQVVESFAPSFAEMTLRQFLDKVLLKITTLFTLQLAEGQIQQGHWYEAQALLEESVLALRDADDLLLYADTIYQLARVAYLLGDLKKARILYRDALRIYQHENHPDRVAQSQLALARLMLMLGYVYDARLYLDQATSYYQQANLSDKMSDVEALQKLITTYEETQTE